MILIEGHSFCKVQHQWQVVVSAGNPGTGNSREFPDFLDSRFPGKRGRDPGKRNPLKTLICEKKYMGSFYMKSVGVSTVTIQNIRMITFHLTGIF